MVLENFREGLGQYILFKLIVFDDKQEIEVACLLLEFVVGLCYYSHDLANAFDVLN